VFDSSDNFYFWWKKFKKCLGRITKYRVRDTTAEVWQVTEEGRMISLVIQEFNERKKKIVGNFKEDES